METSFLYPSCSLTELPSLQTLPLEAVNLERNRLQSLDNLPLSLKSINARYNHLDGDGILLPFPFVETLIVDHNSISLYATDDFRSCYPRLKTLHLTQNNIKDLRWIQNTSIEELSISINPISVLSSLPSSLQTLKADSCRITLVQSRLPSQIERVSLSRNYLRYAGLPLNWGMCLKELHLDSNDIEVFPRKLPDTLCILTLNNNKIESLPSVLPRSLFDLSVKSNRIRQFPKLSNKFRILLLDDNCLTSIPDFSIAKVFSAEYNWNQPIHHLSQTKIRKCWKRYVLTLRLRHYKRVQALREELCIISMMPSRWNQIDVIDPVWFRKVLSHNHTVHH